MGTYDSSCWLLQLRSSGGGFSVREWTSAVPTRGRVALVHSTPLFEVLTLHRAELTLNHRRALVMFVDCPSPDALKIKLECCGMFDQRD